MLFFKLNIWFSHSCILCCIVWKVRYSCKILKHVIVFVCLISNYEALGMFINLFQKWNKTHSHCSTLRSLPKEFLIMLLLFICFHQRLLIRLHTISFNYWATTLWLFFWDNVFPSWGLSTVPNGLLICLFMLVLIWHLLTILETV